MSDFRPLAKVLYLIIFLIPGTLVGFIISYFTGCNATIAMAIGALVGFFWGLMYAAEE